MIDDKDIKAQADLITDGIMGGSEWQTYPLPTTIDEAINTIDDTKLSLALKRKTVNIKVDLGEGGREFTVWTSDLTEDYVRINADYRS